MRRGSPVTRLYITTDTLVWSASLSLHSRTRTRTRFSTRGLLLATHELALGRLAPCGGVDRVIEHVSIEQQEQAARFSTMRALTQQAVGKQQSHQGSAPDRPNVAGR